MPCESGKCRSDKLFTTSEKPPEFAGHRLESAERIQEILALIKEQDESLAKNTIDLERIDAELAGMSQYLAQIEGDIATFPEAHPEDLPETIEILKKERESMNKHKDFIVKAIATTEGIRKDFETMRVRITKSKEQLQALYRLAAHDSRDLAH